jgi:hypothetical protein
MRMTPEQAAWFHRMHTEWFEVMRPFTNGFQISPLFPPLPTLPPERFQQCVMLPSREELLRRLPKGGVCAEIGTQEGLFAEKIWSIVQPDELHLFDLDERWIVARECHLLVRSRVELHLGDSSTNLAGFPSDYFDWIYIDGDHSYEGVNRDIEVARTRVKPGGLLIFNDFTIWSLAECCDYGVPYAVCEFVEQHGWDFACFALHPHLYNDVALRRPW